MSVRPISLWASVFPVLIGGANAWRNITNNAHYAYGVSNGNPIDSSGILNEVPAGTNVSVVLMNASGEGRAVNSALVYFVLCLLTAVFLQMAVNYANDYYDARSGVDAVRRDSGGDGTHPVMSVKFYRKAFYFCFTLAALTGVTLVGLANLSIVEKAVLLGLGGLSLLAAWAYSGSKHPYGYSGWGNLVSFAFFGLLGGLGTYYIVCAGIWPAEQADVFRLIGATVAMGLVIASMMMINDIRDIRTDVDAGKVTFAGKVGEVPARAVYHLTMLLSLILAVCTMHIYLVTLAAALFTVVANIYQIVNLKERAYIKAFGFDILIACSTLLMLLF
jgi:1,4-dihydroxy-2-naphthoate octaprenyltransferase